MKKYQFLTGFIQHYIRIIRFKNQERFRNSAGFTLIELLVVIAILGVLAGAILVAINPLEQLARGRDAGRKTTVSQLGNAIQAYTTSQNGVYPTADTSWITTLQSAGELKTVPAAVTPGCKNATADQNGYCYENNGTDAVIYTLGESASEKTRASCTADQVVWVVWSSAVGKTGTFCAANDTTYPTIGETNIK